MILKGNVVWALTQSLMLKLGQTLNSGHSKLGLTSIQLVIIFQEQNVTNLMVHLIFLCNKKRTV